MTNETLRMQMLSGVITEGQYKAKLQENIDKVDYIINKVGNSYRIFALSPKKGKFEDAESLFGKGTRWKNYSTNGEAQKAIDSLSNSPFDNKRGIDDKSLNESMIGGIVGIGAINQIPPRAKTDYEMAFEHFLGERYEKHFENREQDPYTMEEGEVEETSLYENVDEEVKRKIMQMVDDAKFEDSQKGNDLRLAVTKALFTSDGQEIFKIQMKQKLKKEANAFDYYGTEKITDSEGNIIGKEINTFFNDGMEEGKEVEEPRNY